MADKIAFDLGRVDEIGHAEMRGHRNFGRVEINADDLVGTCKAQALHDIETDTAQAEHDGAAADFDFGGVDNSADAGGYTAADVTDFVKRRVFAHFGQGDFRQDGVVGEGRAAHVMQDRRAVQHGKARGAVGHQALALGAADRLAKVGFRVEAVITLPAFGGVKRDYVVARLQAGDAGADLQNMVGLVDTGGRHDAAQGVGIVNEVLSQRLSGTEVQLPGDVPDFGAGKQPNRHDAPLPQTGHAPQPCLSCVTSAIAICSSLVARSALSAYRRPPLRTQVFWSNCTPP